MAETAPPVFKKRGNKSTIRKRPATPPPASDSDHDSFDSDSDNENTTRIKRQKRQSTNTASTETNANPSRHSHDPSKSATTYTADRSSKLAKEDDATRTSNWNNSTSTAAASSEPETARATARQQAQPGQPGDGVYRGAKGYSNFVAKRGDQQSQEEQKDGASAQAKTVGPVKSASNVRTITVTDFAPDVCKDYKQTGFCGFGDSCKFLHAREDYKQGWQLDKEWESVAAKGSGKAMAKPGNERTDEEKLLESIPFKCVICKGDYQMPIVTKCGHYFCEKCAFTRYGKEKKKGCAACGADTGGTFNVARKLKELLKKKKVREEEKAAKEAEEA